MNTKKEYEIMNGPSKDALFDACKYACSKNARIALEFSIAAGYTTPPENPNCAYVPLKAGDYIITMIQHEDGSGESFNLSGFCKADTDVFGKGTLESYEFSMYFNTKSRKGHITLFN